MMVRMKEAAAMELDIQFLVQQSSLVAVHATTLPWGPWHILWHNYTVNEFCLDCLLILFVLFRHLSPYNKQQCVLHPLPWATTAEKYETGPVRSSAVCTKIIMT